MPVIRDKAYHTQGEWSEVWTYTVGLRDVQPEYDLNSYAAIISLSANNNLKSMRTIAVATRLNYTCQWATQAQFLGGQDGPSSSLVSTVLQAPVEYSNRGWRCQVPIQLEDRVPAVAHFTMSLLVGSGPDTIPPTDGVPVVKPTKARVLSVSSLSY